MDSTSSSQTAERNHSNYPVVKILQLIVLISVILYFGQTLFIPLSFALLISFILFPSCSLMERKGLNRSVSIAIAITILTLLFASIFYLLFYQFAGFANEWHEIRIKLSEKLASLTTYVAIHFNISEERQTAWLKKIVESTGAQLFPFLKTTFYSISVSSVLIIIIPVISFLILYHRHLLMSVLYGLFPAIKKENLKSLMHDVVHTYFSFIKGMLIVYLIVGVLNSIGLAIIGVPHPILFGFIASILTFIPYVGIVIGSLLPISVSWIEYNTIWYPLGVILVFTIVQYLEANIIFPVAVSRRLKINSLVTIITIIAGGILWGAIGMILFIPFLGILKLIADKTEGMKLISIVMGGNEPVKKSGDKKF